MSWIVSLQPVIAWGPFASGGMLAFGLGAAIPVLIHLWSRRRRREAPWAAMQFLLAALRRSARRLRWQHRTLLAVRCAIPLVLALALADPAWPPAESAGGPGPGHWPTHYVLVLDGSYSMAYGPPEQTRMERAKQRVERTLAEAAPGDAFSLILMADSPQTVIGPPVMNPADVLEEIHRLRPPDGGAALGPALAEAESVLQAAAEQRPQLERRRVIFYTDLGATTWAEASQASVRRRLARLGQLASLHVVDVGGPGAANAAVTNLALEAGPALANQPLAVRVELRRWGPAAADQRRRVQLLVDGRPAAQQPVVWDAAGAAAVVFAHRFAAAGEHVLEARLDGDLLPLDDHRWLSVPVRRAIRVLCVEGRPGEARHLALAMAPDPQQAGWIEPDVAGDGALAERDLRLYDCVAMCNVAQTTPDEASLLRRFLDRGGGLIWFLGDLVRLENYNQELWGGDERRRVIPARLIGLAPFGRYGFEPLSYAHPLLAAFRGREATGLENTPIWKYVRLAPASGARVALAFSSGDPAVVEQSLGRGRAVVVAAPPSPLSLDPSAAPPSPWSAWSSWPTFLPLVHELVRLAASGEAEPRNGWTGQPLAGTSGQPLVRLRRPDGEQVRVRTAPGPDGRRRWTYDDTWRCGVYEVWPAAEAAGSGPQRYAVNVDPSEGDMARVAPGDLPPPLRLGDAAPQEPPAGTAPERGAFRWLLAGVLVLLLLESVLAWRFGAVEGAGR